MSAPTIPGILESARELLYAEGYVDLAKRDVTLHEEGIRMAHIQVLNAGLMWFRDAGEGFEPTDRAFKISFQGRAILALAEAILAE